MSDDYPYSPYEGDNKLAGQMFGLLFVVYGIPTIAAGYVAHRILKRVYR